MVNIADPRRLVNARIKKHYLQMAQPVSFNLQQQWWGDKQHSLQNPMLQLVAQSNFLNVVDQMHHLSSVPSSVLETKIQQSPSWSSLTSPLGKFVSLGLSQKKTMEVQAVQVDSANQVPREVFEQVLTGAELALNIQHSVDAYYFTKENIYQASADIKILRKLGPGVNLTSHDSQSIDGNVVMDVKIHLENTLISIRYGADIQSEKGRILRHVAKVTIRRAWQKQKELLLNNLKTEYPWNAYEKDQLIRSGIVANYQVMFNKDIEKYPQLASDISNVIFVPPNKP